MGIELSPSAEFTPAQLADLFTASYEGYFVPFTVDEPTFVSMTAAFDLDLAKSLVAAEDGTPIGLASMGRRGGRTWLGGLGVVPAKRRAGVGELLTRSLLDRARRAGAREMVLEAIVENEPAIALYEKLGFERTRELEVLSLAIAKGGGAAEEIPVKSALALIAARRDGPEPWQREDRTVENLTGLASPPRALMSGDAAAVYREDAGRIGLLQAAGGGGGLAPIIDALRAKGPVTAANYPAGGPVAAALREAGATVTLRQYEMALAL